MKKTKEQLLAFIDDMRASIADNDSFGGRMSYDAMADGLQQGEFEVEIYYAVGNKGGGQGGCVLVQGTPQGEQG